MRSILTIIILLIGLSSTAFAEQQTVSLTIEKMYCALCPITVSKAMEQVEGVSQVEVSFETKLAVVTFDNAITEWEQVALASTNAGYPASLPSL